VNISIAAHHFFAFIENNTNFLAVSNMKLLFLPPAARGEVKENDEL
jgi:hypothetical protein